jgi:hypothetical protein
LRSAAIHFSTGVQFCFTECVSSREEIGAIVVSYQAISLQNTGVVFTDEVTLRIIASRTHRSQQDNDQTSRKKTKQNQFSLRDPNSPGNDRLEFKASASILCARANIGHDVDNKIVPFG